MALTIAVRLREGRYDAAFPPDREEWPPHPARLFCALVASAEHEPGADGHPADMAALRWLEAAGPPLVQAIPPDAVESATRSGYAVTNSVRREGGSTTWPGRTNGRIGRRGVLPSDEHVAFVWPDAAADDGLLWRLHRLARRVPYLGRSASSAQVTVHDEVPSEEAGQVRPGWVTYRPVAIGTPGALDLRVPYPGYTDQLREAYERGERAWEISRVVAYGLGAGTSPAPDAPPLAAASARGPYQELVIWPLRRGGIPVSGDRLLTVTELLRRTVISRVADPVPPEVSGHGADTRPHLAYLALTDVGHRHADGHLLGVAVAVPAALSGEARMATLRGLLGDGGEDPIRELRGGANGLFALEDPGEPPQLWGLRPDRWAGSISGARRWTSVTPVMLDRYPGRRDPADVLSDTIVTAGYPRPESVTVLDTPVPRGAVHLPCRGTVPAGRPRRPLLHCRVEFVEPIRGPVIAGALRYLGCGLLVPEVDDADR